MPGEDDDNADIRLGFADSGKQRISIGGCKLTVCDDDHVNIYVKRIEAADEILLSFKSLIHDANIVPREVHGKLSITLHAEP